MRTFEKLIDLSMKIGFAVLFYVIHLLMKYIGVAAYFATAASIGYGLAVPVSYVERVTIGSDLISGYIILGASGFLLAYLLSYDHAPTSNAGAYKGPIAAWREAKQLVDRSSNGFFSGIKAGFSIGIGTSNTDDESAYAGLSTVVEAYIALGMTIVESLRAKALRPDPRVVANVWFISTTLEPEEAATYLSLLRDGRSREQKLAAIYLADTANAHGISKILNQSEISAVELADTVVSLLPSDDEMLVVKLGELGIRMNNNTHNAMEEYSGALLEYIEDESLDATELQGPLAICSNLFRFDSDDDIESQKNLNEDEIDRFSDALAKHAKNDDPDIYIMAVMGLTGIGQYYPLSNVSEHDDVFIQIIEDTVKDYPNEEQYLTEEFEFDETTPPRVKMLVESAFALGALGMEYPERADTYLDILGQMLNHGNKELHGLGCIAVSLLESEKANRTLENLINNPDYEVPDLALEETQDVAVDANQSSVQI